MRCARETGTVQKFPAASTLPDMADYRRRMFLLNNETSAVREELSHYVETVTMYFFFPSPS